MTATLYQPNQPALIVPIDGLTLPNSNGYAVVTERIAKLLDCSINGVDILASSDDYVAYSIFDNEGETNLPAMITLSILTGYSFDPEIEDEILSGNILIITRD
jgi:hypothetical protein